MFLIFIPTHVFWISVCIHLKTKVVLLKCNISPHGSQFVPYLSLGTFWDMSLVIGLEARMGGRSGPGENQHCLVQWLSQERPLEFP